MVGAKLGPVSDIAGAAAGPFTVHFWAPMSKWLISGASFLDLDRPTDKVSLSNYTALTLTGLFFSRYAMLVTPINYMLCSVNIALFSTSFYHLARKINAVSSSNSLVARGVPLTLDSPTGPNGCDRTTWAVVRRKSRRRRRNEMTDVCINHKRKKDRRFFSSSYIVYT